MDHSFALDGDAFNPCDDGTAFSACDDGARRARDDDAAAVAAVETAAAGATLVFAFDGGDSDSADTEREMPRSTGGAVDGLEGDAGVICASTFSVDVFSTTALAIVSCHGHTAKQDHRGVKMESLACASAATVRARASHTMDIQRQHAHVHEHMHTASVRQADNEAAM